MFTQYAKWAQKHISREWKPEVLGRLSAHIFFSPYFPFSTANQLDGLYWNRSTSSWGCRKAEKRSRMRSPHFPFFSFIYFAEQFCFFPILILSLFLHIVVAMYWAPNCVRFQFQIDIILIKFNLCLTICTELFVFIDWYIYIYIYCGMEKKLLYREKST